MTVRCSSTRDAISGILLAGDAVLNLSPQQLNCVADTPFLTVSGRTLQVVREPANVDWRDGLETSPDAMAAEEVARVVIVSTADCPLADRAVAAFETAGIPHVHCTLAEDCDADAFMDDADSDAVAERLRQLGYI